MPDDCKLFVGSISYDIDNQSLEDAFAKYGEVTDAFIVRESGYDRGPYRERRSKGYGFVTFKHAEDAEAAKDEMDKTDIGGRTINVEYASDKGERRSGGGDRRSGGYGGGYGGSRYSSNDRGYDRYDRRSPHRSSGGRDYRDRDRDYDRSYSRSSRY